jgi:hypothetical protein
MKEETTAVATYILQYHPWLKTLSSSRHPSSANEIRGQPHFNYGETPTNLFGLNL